MILLKMRTGKMKKRRKQASQELKSLRRIIGLPDNGSLYSDEEAEEMLDLQLNL